MTTNHPTDEQLWELRRQAKDDPRCADQHWFILFARAAIAASHGVTAAPQEGVRKKQSAARQLSNIAYNWAQQEGKTLNARDCALLKELAALFDSENRAPESPQPLAPPPGWKMLTLDEIDEVFERPRPYNAFVYQAKDLIDAFIAKNSPPGRGMVPMSEEQTEAAAKMLAKCMDYPWAEMPTQGRITMRKHAQAIVAAGTTPLGDGEGAMP